MRGTVTRIVVVAVGEPSAIDISPLVLEFPKNQSLVAGQTIRLPCLVKHDDQLPVTVTWLSDNEPILDSLIKSGHLRIDKDNALIIHESRRFDSALYKCVAESRLDKVEREARLVIKDVPERPYAASAVCGDNKRNVAVEINHNEREDSPAPVTSFFVQYKLVNEGDNAWATHQGSNMASPFSRSQENIDRSNGIRVITVTQTVEVPPFGTYEFRVFARNDVGDSAPVAIREQCIAPAMVPDENPSGVFIASGTNDDLTAYWTPMPRDKWNGPDFKYVVKYRPQGAASDVEYKTVEVADPYADHVVIKDPSIKPYQSYDVQVQAVNREGASKVQPQTHRGYSGEGVPLLAPSNFKRVSTNSGRSATFSWDAVDRNSMNGELKGYKIVHWHVQPRPCNASAAAPGARFRREGL